MKQEVDTKFYTFNQNNSGGKFRYDKNLSEVVVIEAISARHANELAENLGIYFNGCEDGRDCSCCGDRWSKVYDDDDGYDKPSYYGEEITEDYKPKYGTFTRDQPWCFIHYMDGTKTTIKGC